MITACGGEESAVQYNPQDYAGKYYGKGNPIIYANFNAEDMTVYVLMRAKSMLTYSYTTSWRVTDEGMVFTSEENPDINIIRCFDGNVKIVDVNGRGTIYGTLNKE